MKAIRLMWLFTALITVESIAQEIPYDQVVSNSELSALLTASVQKELGKSVNDKVALASYFRAKFSERYFFDWQSVDSRMRSYSKTFPGAQAGHKDRAWDHMKKYAPETTWKLPFDYLFGDPVNAYALRHLARQHKMVDIAFLYHYENKNPAYIDYFTGQMASLNDALVNNRFETIADGNGVYEAFRSGYRILNWLLIHNLFMDDSTYSDEDQLTTIATLLQHGAHLYAHNEKFHPGNHQTRGLSALAMLAILLRDFKDTDKWYERAMKLLEEHMLREINDDGFQFERSLHYHISDIGNYFYVYQLAMKSEMEVSDLWHDRLRGLFTTIVKIGYPDGSAPVLQDDTDIPWAEKNDITGAMTLGYAMYGDPVLGYFANGKVDQRMYWYLNDEQLSMLSEIKKEQPKAGSLHFPTTGYYVMREGWNADDMMMIVTAGLDKHKPDHQHGDMLGIQAMANGQVLLPNYQVRYYLEDLELFKNSMVKNVAIVDDQLQGQEYTSNKGGSGFGKFRKLPKPKTISWESNKSIDLFVGNHDGFEDQNVSYTRQVIFVKNDFWIVKDNFKGTEEHDYRQIWQGHYTSEHFPTLLRATYDYGAGFDILQLNPVTKASTDGRRGKQWTVVTKEKAQEYSFITVLFPYSAFDRRIDETTGLNSFGNWEVNRAEGTYTSSVSTDGKLFSFESKDLKVNDINIYFKTHSDVFVQYNKGQIVVQNVGAESVQFNIDQPDRIMDSEKFEKGYELVAGQKIKLWLK